MKLKQIFSYFLWIVLSLLIGIVYMRILLGSTTESTTALSYLLHIFYSYGVLYVGGIIGLIIAFIFIALEIFYLKKKLKDHAKKTVIRLGLLFLIAVFAGITHYVLEKVIDVI